MRAYMVVLALITLILGIAEIACGFGLELSLPMPYIPSDIFGGFALLVISATFSKGALSEEPRAHLYIGSILLAIFGLLYILVFLANGLDSVILGEEWQPLGDIRPEMFILLLSIPGLLSVRKKLNENP